MKEEEQWEDEKGKEEDEDDDDENKEERYQNVSQPPKLTLNVYYKDCRH